MTIEQIRMLVRHQLISRMVLVIDETSYSVEFFVPKKKVDWMLQWCKENLSENLNYKVGSLWGIGKTMKKYQIEERTYKFADTHNLNIDVSFGD